MAAFQKVFPRVNVVLHDFSRHENIEGLQNGTLHLALTPNAAELTSMGIEFEELRTYPFCVAMPHGHSLSRLKAIPLEKVATEPLIALRLKDYPEYQRVLDRLFGPLGVKPRIAMECDTASSLFTAVEAGRGIALSTSVFGQMTGKRLVYRSLTGTNEVLSVGIARAKNGDVTPAGEKFCEILRKVTKETSSGKSLKLRA